MGTLHHLHGSPLATELSASVNLAARSALPQQKIHAQHLATTTLWRDRDERKRKVVREMALVVGPAPATCRCETCGEPVWPREFCASDVNTGRVWCGKCWSVRE